MNNQHDRRLQVLQLAAEKARRLPVQPSGLWFHGDVRDNVYYAMHLFAACKEDEGKPDSSIAEGVLVAESMLRAVLSLQVKNPEDPMFGHWPLHLGADPKLAPAHTLPVELMGSLLAWFHFKYAAGMSVLLRQELSESLQCIYLGGYYRKPVEAFNHHEAKYISQQLIWGELYADPELAEVGRLNLKRMLDTIRANGMREYGALPWFWHWVQAFTFARELVTKDKEALLLLDGMLDYLWKMRASVYLKGAWAGPHSRVLPHDVPADRNHLTDYVVFGDFPLPSDIWRLEAAGLLEHRVDHAVLRLAQDRTESAEVKRLVPVDPERVEAGAHHMYVYMTPDYAVGGIWERAEEYLNEQHRWDVTLPVSADDGRANQAFFFRPGAGYSEGDLRHQSGGSEVLFHQNTAAALYGMAASDYPSATEGLPPLLGCLPLGDWRFMDCLMVGMVNGVYLIVHLMQPYAAEQGGDRVNIRSLGEVNGAVVEAVDAKTAEARGWRDLTAVAGAAAAAPTLFSVEEDGGLKLVYRTLSHGAVLAMRMKADGSLAERSVDGNPVTFDDYTVKV